jgi:hypothetical protein
MPDSADSSIQLQSAIARLIRSQRPEKLAAMREASGSQLDTANGWCVGQVHVRERLDRDTSLATIAQRVHVPGPVLWPAFAATREAGYLTGTEERLAVTPLGRAELEKLVATVRAWLAGELADWGAADDTKLTTALTALARHLVDDDPQTYTPVPSPNSLRAGPAAIEKTKQSDPPERG